MPVDQESAAVVSARAHAEARSNHDWAKAREGPAADIHVTATTTLPAARLYLFDEDDKIKAEQIAFFAAPGFRSSDWITGPVTRLTCSTSQRLKELLGQRPAKRVTLQFALPFRGPVTC